MPSDPAAVPRISFAIPYYDGLHYLREAIGSVLAQTVTDWELVVVDDRGPEPAGEVVAAYDDPRISSVRNERNLGLAGNWNECVSRTRAPLLTILHGDDRLLPDYAARVLDAADRHPDVAAVFTDALTIGSSGQPTRTLADRVKERMPRPGGDHRLQGDADLAGLLRGNYIVCPSMCLRRELVGAAPFDDSLRFVPDWDFTTRMLMEGRSLFGVRTPLIEYRRHSDSQTSLQTEDASRFEEELRFLRRVAGDADRLDLPRSAAMARRRVTVRGHLAVQAGLDAVARRWPNARAKWRILRTDLVGSADVRPRRRRGPRPAPPARGG